MSCNCGTAETQSGLWTSISNDGVTEITPGEDVECYMQRAPDTLDKSGTPETPDKIKNTTVVPDCSMKIDMKFVLTDDSKTPVVKWRMVNPDNKTQDITISGLTFNQSTGALIGTMDSLSEGKKFNIMIIAYKDATTEIDSRSYNFSPKKCVPGADLKFIHPLPGSVITSPFGPRKSPTAGASRDHKGCDFAYSGGVTKDVLASCDGIVTKAGPGTGYGNVVYISHSNGSGRVMAETRYAHLEKFYVSKDQQVSAGQPIGKEGHTGIGTGAHLHFELRLAGDKPVDPTEYINGSLKSSKADISSGVSDPGSPTGNIKTKSQTDKGLTTSKVDSIQEGCKAPPNTAAKPMSEAKPGPADNAPAKAASQSSCKPDTPMKVSEVKAKINEVLDKHPELDTYDRAFLLKMAEIESSFDPYAKAKTTNATGLYQMVDKTAAFYYAKIGKEPTCENRCNIELATEAQLRFYKNEILAYYKEFKTSYAAGKPKIAGKPISQTLANRYNEYSKSLFCYGLIHHDGVGNAVAGIDRDGIRYAKSVGMDRIA